MIKGKISIPLVLFILTLSTHEGRSQISKEEIQTLSEAKLLDGLTEFREFLSIPNNASYPDHVRMNVEWCESAFEKRGFSIQVLDTGGPPILLAERNWTKKGKTVLVYLQIDGQPVDSSYWNQESPYIPALKSKEGDQWQIIDWSSLDSEIDPDWRIFARSASDAKGPVNMFLTSLDIIDEQKFKPNYNLKVIMDFEEELGSPHLPAAVVKYKDELAADMLIIFDGPRHITNQPTLTFGARGITTITLTSYGPRAPQHSGHYGNYAPNPALKMSQLLGSMKDKNGKVVIPGYYDDVRLTDETKKILSQVPDDEDQIRKNIGVAEIDDVADNYQESIQYPSLNIRGLQSAWVGDLVRTIVPSVAVAEIDVRLVPETSSDKLVNMIQQHIKDQGYTIIDHDPTEEERMSIPNLIKFEYDNSYAAFRTDFNEDVGVWLYSALKRAFETEPIRIRMSGGSIPIAPFVSTLGIPAVTVPTVNRDNNQHSPNENLRIGNFADGIRTFVAILTEDL